MILEIFTFCILNCFMNFESRADIVSLRTPGSIYFGIYPLHQTPLGHQPICIYVLMDNIFKTNY